MPLPMKNAEQHSEDGLPILRNKKAALFYVFGNTHDIGHSKGKHINYWHIFVDVLKGHADLINQVKFEMKGSSSSRSAVLCNCPAEAMLRNGSPVMRFSTPRQQSPGPLRATIILMGTHGKKIYINTELKKGGKRNAPRVFFDPRLPRPLRMIDRNFGIELELSCARGTPEEEVARHIQQYGKVGVDVVQSYREGKKDSSEWKLVADSSITCSRSSPECSKFELVSPKLNGGEGLGQCNRVLEAVNSTVSISVNKSMGFHVHIGVEGLSFDALKKVCQNFVKYEDVIDTFMPPSRRSGSDKMNDYCKSNKSAVMGANRSHSQGHQRIASSTSINELCDVMNPDDDRYYKLNLQNLKTGRQPTIEFRQHSATSNYPKVSSWVRFCMALVYNSAHQPQPSCPRESHDTDEQFEKLFQSVIHNRALRELFAVRRENFKSTATNNSKENDCCDGCTHGGTCTGLNKGLFLP